MTIKKAFEKLGTYNELATLMGERKKEIWFADALACGIYNSETFSDLASFRKYVRREYIKDVADKILTREDWELNGELEIESVTGSTLKFELDLCNA